MFYCDHCGQEIVKSYPGGKVKLRTNIVVFEADGSVFCKCQQCHADVKIPLVLKLPTGETVPSERKMKHYIIETKHEKEKPK